MKRLLSNLKNIDLHLEWLECRYGHNVRYVVLWIVFVVGVAALWYLGECLDALMR